MRSTVLLWIFITFVMVTSCKKYEEGPAISFRSAKNRIEGTWNAVSGTVDGENIYQTYIDTFTRVLSCGTVSVTEEQRMKKLIWEINDNGKVFWKEYWTEKKFNSASTEASSCIPTYNYNEFEPIPAEFSWELQDNNKKFVIKTEDGVEYKFTILELRNKSLHLKGTIDGYQVDIKLEQ